ncbi:MAG: type II toxin-antitoxin system VapC family toxin [Deltaproteobacteria bacterium]|nr:type II toxin-antitoxin system VapC family toxin [Deltaproteobacteria bacterium]
MKERSRRGTRALYWDASALVSMLVENEHSAAARRAAAAREAAHFVSSLASAEVHAVIARLARERILQPDQARDARTRLAGGPWRWTRIQPDVARLGDLALRHPLRGADLWHLGAALALADLLPGLELFGFDQRLMAAAAAEGLAPPGVPR